MPNLVQRVVVQTPAAPFVDPLVASNAHCSVVSVSPTSIPAFSLLPVETHALGLRRGPDSAPLLSLDIAHNERSHGRWPPAATQHLLHYYLGHSWKMLWFEVMFAAVDPLSQELRTVAGAPGAADFHVGVREPDEEIHIAGVQGLVPGGDGLDLRAHPSLVVA